MNLCVYPQLSLGDIHERRINWQALIIR